MDSALANVDISRLNETDKRELQQVIQAETQKNQIQQSTYPFQSYCAHYQVAIVIACATSRPKDMRLTFVL